MTSIPGFEGIPVWDVIQFFSQEARRDRLTVRASAMAFNFLLATFPTLLFFFTLIPYIPIQDLDKVLTSVLGLFMPIEALKFIDATTDDIFRKQRPDLLSIGFVLAFFFATSGVNSMIAAFNKQHPSYLKRNFWQLRGASIRLTLYLFVLFISSLILIIGGGEIIQYTQTNVNFFDRRMGLWAISIFRWVVVILMYFLTISFIYHYGPARANKWKFVTAGSTLATLMSITATVGFAFFVNRYGVYNEIYGSIGALIVFMVWMNINTFVLLVGFELNNSIDMNRLIRLKKDGNSAVPHTPSEDLLR